MRPATSDAARTSPLARSVAAALVAVAAATFVVSPVSAAQIALTDPIPDNPSTCSLINQNSLCVPWSRTFAFDGPDAPGIDSELAVPDGFPMAAGNFTTGGRTITTNFDYNLMYWATSQNMTSLFNQKYSCNWTGRGLRYQVSYGCALAIDAYGACNGDNSYLRPNTTAGIPKGSVRPLLCSNTCLQYYHDILNIFESSLCDSVDTLVNSGRKSILDQREQDLIAIYDQCTNTGLRPIATSNATFCVQGVPTESVRCGFLNTELANAYCGQWTQGLPGVTTDSTGAVFLYDVEKPNCCASVALGPNSTVDAGTAYLLDYRPWTPADGLPVFQNITLLSMKTKTSLQVPTPAGTIGLIGAVFKFVKSLSSGAIAGIVISILVFFGTVGSGIYRWRTGFWPAFCLCCAGRRKSGMQSSSYKDSDPNMPNMEYPTLTKRFASMMASARDKQGGSATPEMSSKPGVFGFLSNLVPAGYLNRRKLRVAEGSEEATADMHNGYAVENGSMKHRLGNGSQRFGRTAAAGVELDIMQDMPDKKKIRDAWMTFDDDSLGTSLNPSSRTRTGQILAQMAKKGQGKSDSAKADKAGAQAASNTPTPVVRGSERSGMAQSSLFGPTPLQRSNSRGESGETTTTTPSSNRLPRSRSQRISNGGNQSAGASEADLMNFDVPPSAEPPAKGNVMSSLPALDNPFVN
ncbi:hypothetical protein M427DRAFT_72297 [Gonapodya prolifera JEL478]|uniref:Uncharacterized protein n=1 Tax=Gonapodya prolifera (strain JEL478) TaxID=1344416 RepID=A0A139A5F4_GONPJ|nr:hypothetical protein M427DRAFT_72297 [Gonapodya prolifera JEL478]|eukprot:KXS12006.1 hypothetical protein M427DRAFT_72297 [Gonapodya prolifera JEL478]